MRTCSGAEGAEYEKDLDTRVLDGQTIEEETRKEHQRHIVALQRSEDTSS